MWPEAGAEITTQTSCVCKHSHSPVEEEQAEDNKHWRTDEGIDCYNGSCDRLSSMDLKACLNSSATTSTQQQPLPLTTMLLLGDALTLCVSTESHILYNIRQKINFHTYTYISDLLLIGERHSFKPWLNCTKNLSRYELASGMRLICWEVHNESFSIPV